MLQQIAVGVEYRHIAIADSGEVESFGRVLLRISDVELAACSFDVKRREAGWDEVREGTRRRELVIVRVENIDSARMEICGVQVVGRGAVENTEAETVAAELSTLITAGHLNVHVSLACFQTNSWPGDPEVRYRSRHGPPQPARPNCHRIRPAREAMLTAKLELEHAKEIAQAADHIPDFAGNAGKKKAAEKHGLAVDDTRGACRVGPTCPRFLGGKWHCECGDPSCTI